MQFLFYRPKTCWDAISLFINILSILRLFIFFHPKSDVVITPSILQHILHVKLNDIVVISLWLLLPILCARAFLSQLKAKSKDMEFRMLFYESLFGDESHIFKSCVPILMILLTPLSLGYIWTIVKYIYVHWTVEFATILHALQLYPALFMLFQSVFQGCYLLWMYALPTFRDIHMKKESYQSDLREYIYVNIMFSVHCMCLTVIAHKEEPGLYHLAIGEIAYRSLAVVSLFFLSHQTTSHITPPPASSTLPPTSSSTPTVFSSESKVCEAITEQSNCGHSLLVCSFPSVTSSNHHPQVSPLGDHSPPQQKMVRTVPESATPQREADSAELVTLLQLHLQRFEFSNLDAENMFLSSDASFLSTNTVPLQCTEHNTTSPQPQDIC